MTADFDGEESRNRLLREIRDELDLSELDDNQLFQRIERKARQLSPPDLSLDQLAELCDSSYAEIRGYGAIDCLVHSEEVTEIMVNAYDSIFIEREGRLEKTSLAFSSPQKYVDLIQKIVSRSGREVHQRSPVVDCRMEDGSRVNVVLAPIASGDHAMTIRKFRDHILTLDELVENQTISKEACSFLKQAVQAHLNIFISGGTGSGKTTFLNALANEIDPRERLITIEDSRELNFSHMPNWVALQSRAATINGEGEVSIRDLIRTSLRMRPDRIIVGEVRGEEALDMLQAMNTGHDGSFSTGHANSIQDMQYRLETMVLMGHEGLPLSAIDQQIGAALDLFLHMSRLKDKSRRLAELDELVFEEGRLSFHPLFRLNEGNELLWLGERMKRTEKFYRYGIQSEWIGEEEEG